MDNSDFKWFISGGVLKVNEGVELPIRETGRSSFEYDSNGDVYTVSIIVSNDFRRAAAA